MRFLNICFHSGRIKRLCLPGQHGIKMLCFTLKWGIYSEVITKLCFSLILWKDFSQNMKIKREKITFCGLKLFLFI